jgi:hypothetical protein
MMLRLLIVLPPWPGRAAEGEAALYGADGAELARFRCLGKADNFKARDKGNPGRDPLKPWGDTPSGTYAPQLVARLNGRRREFLGDWFLPLVEPTHGPAVAALDVRGGGRTALGVHAGRGDRKLMPTNGCVRIETTAMDRLAQLAAGQPILPVVEERLPARIPAPAGSRPSPERTPP